MTAGCPTHRSSHREIDAAGHCGTPPGGVVLDAANDGHPMLVLARHAWRSHAKRNLPDPAYGDGSRRARRVERACPNEGVIAARGIQIPGQHGGGDPADSISVPGNYYIQVAV